MGHRRKTQIKLTLFIVIFLVVTTAYTFNVHAKTIAKPIYTITPTSKTFDSIYMNSKNYNKNTKHFFILRSYLEQLEKTRGGKLVLKRGTYTISNTLYIPSNSTIEFADGVKIVKGSTTGNASFMPSSTLFQLIRPSYANKTGVYGKFNGEKNISFIGKGTVTMDLKLLPRTFAIIMGHNKNILVDHINFKNMNGGHFIEMDASQKVQIKNSSFKKSLHVKGHDKEGINLDTPDRQTGGWGQKWSKYDNQANDQITIENNLFDHLDRAVGTHKYSKNQLHNKVIIRNNTIKNMSSDSIRVMNWSNTIIENNLFSVTKDAELTRNTRGILLSGASNPKIQKNSFNYIPRAMQFIVWKNSNGGTTVPIYNTLSNGNKKTLENNEIHNAYENIIRITNTKFGDYSKSENISFPKSTLRKELQPISTPE